MNQPKRKTPCSDPSPQSNHELSPLVAQGHFFEIRIKGQLSDIWADWFEGFSVECLDNGDMLLCGYVVDQSALMGILNKLVRLNLNLISLNEIQKEKK